jgi:hypothetical protein
MTAPIVLRLPFPQLSACDHGDVTVISVLAAIRRAALTPAWPDRSSRSSPHESRKRTGRITGNRRLKTEGRTDQVAGETKQATDKVKDAFKH